MLNYETFIEKCDNLSVELQILKRRTVLQMLRKKDETRSHGHYCSLESVNQRILSRSILLDFA